MKENQRKTALFLASCIPWGFVAVYADLVYSSILGYGLMLLFTVVIGLRVRKCSRGPAMLLGSGLPLFFSCLLLSFFRENWNVYLKPFGTLGTAAVLHGYCLMLQYVIFHWKRERTTTQNFFLAVSGVTLLLSTLIYVFLSIKAAQFGAV